ncbi:MAG: DNA polymerase III subunit gamma/tau, partial [Pseudomonadota bacterium]
MSYLVLARKWRPQTFTDVVGQGHVLRALAHALDNDRLHHAYLFAGTRGVGKTTLARILAKALNCEEGVSSTPCGVCSACTEIDAGRFVDLIEVDAASRTKVDDTRELLDNVQYAATRGRYKVYLIDEVHMLSAHSFNALLKTLEEPPPHVKFLLATTDPQKLPVTVLSRCLQFNLLRLSEAEIAERLETIAAAEGIAAEASALQLLARAADGSLRDALSLTDQAIAFGDGALTGESVADMLGTLGDDVVSALLEALADRDGERLVGAIAELDQRAPDYAQLLDALAERLSELAVWQATSVAPGGDSVALGALAQRISSADTQLWYQIALHGKRDLVLAPQPRIGAEMTLLRMLAFAPASSTVMAPEAPSGGQVARTAAPASASTLPSAEPATVDAAPSTTPTDGDAAAASDHNGLADRWHRIVGQLELSGMVRLLAANCTCVGYSEGKVSLALDRLSESLLKDDRVAELGRALANYLGEDVDVTVRVDGNVVGQSPAQREMR